MRASAHIRADDGTEYHLGHGDLIGRLWSAAFYVDDPRISEAHAMVSLRGDALHLLALRGRFVVGESMREDVRLEAGLVVKLAPDVTLEVIGVTHPDAVLGLEAPGMGRRVLHGTCGLVGGARPAIVAATAAEVVAHVWFGAEGWRVRPVGGIARALGIGDVVDVDGVPFTAVEVTLGGQATPDRTSAESHLRVVARYDTVHLQRPGRVTAALNGVPARLVSELVRFGTPVPWAMLAGELWPEPDADPGALRKRLDAALHRLRARLADIGVRGDLVRSTGAGQIELFLQPGDVVEDQT